MKLASIGKGLSRQFAHILTSISPKVAMRVAGDGFIISMIHHMEKMEEEVIKMAKGKGDLKEINFHKSQAIKRMIVFTDEKRTADKALKVTAKLLKLPPLPSNPN